MREHIPDPATQSFVTHRNLLFTVAYEMLGSATDAEDVLQETWLRWVKVDLAQVRDGRAYLVRITTRLSLDRLGNALHIGHAFLCASERQRAGEGHRDPQDARRRPGHRHSLLDERDREDHQAGKALSIEDSRSQA